MNRFFISTSLAFSNKMKQMLSLARPHHTVSVCVCVSARVDREREREKRRDREKMLACTLGASTPSKKNKSRQINISSGTDPDTPTIHSRLLFLYKLYAVNIDGMHLRTDFSWLHLLSSIIGQSQQCLLSIIMSIVGKEKVLHLSTLT